MIFDCFPFFNELDLLEIRLNILMDVVDKFVVVEAGETHTGKPKPFYFEANRGRFAAFEDRIVYRKIERFPAGHDAWWNENYQRNEISKALAEIGVRDDDDIMISDLDEIPNPDEVAKWKGTPGIKVFHQKYYSFYLNYYNVRHLTLRTTKMMPYSMSKTCYDGLVTMHNEFVPEDINQGTTLTKIRRRSLPRSRGGERLIKNGGWHFTCLGGAAAMLTKMRAVAPHHDFNPEDPNLTVEKLEEMIAKGEGPALKMNCFAVPIDESFPAYIRENQEKLAKLIFPITEEYIRSVCWRRLVCTLQGRMIQLGEMLCPDWLHNQLHLIKMRLIKGNR